MKNELFLLIERSFLPFLPKKTEVELGSNVSELFDGNVYHFGLALLNVHEQLGLQVAYSPATEFEHFQTVEDVMAYFESKNTPVC